MLFLFQSAHSPYSQFTLFFFKYIFINIIIYIYYYVSKSIVSYFIRHRCAVSVSFMHRKYIPVSNFFFTAVLITKLRRPRNVTQV